MRQQFVELNWYGVARTADSSQPLAAAADANAF
jgi:hypothetical protein